MEWERKRKVMEEWSYKLKGSGYPHSFRHQVLKAAVEKWDVMRRVEDNGGRPIYRSREGHEDSRRLEKERKRESWHQGDKTDPQHPAS